MDRISGMNYVVVDGLRKFTDSPPGTVLTASWLNGIQEELCYLIEQMGFSTDATDTTQVYEAIQALIRSYFDTGGVDFNVRFLRLSYGNSVTAAINDLGNTQATLVIDTPATLTASSTFHRNTTVWFLGSGQLTLGAYDLTIDGGMIADPAMRIFNDTGAGVVKFGGAGYSNVLEVYPQWWVDKDSLYYDAALESALIAHNRVALIGGYSYGGFSFSSNQYTILASVPLPADHREIVGYGMPVIYGQASVYSFDTNRADGRQWYYRFSGLHFHGHSFFRHLDTTVLATDDCYRSFLIENCRFEQNDDYTNALLYFDGVGTGEIRDCHFYGDFTTSVNSRSIHRQNTDTTIIKNCSFELLQDGIRDEGSAGTLDRGCHLIGCRFNDVADCYHGIETDHIRIIDCFFTDSDDAIICLGCDDVVIRGCEFNECGGDHIIEIDEDTGTAEDIRVQDNLFTSNCTASTPISINNGFGVHVKGNRIEYYNTYGIEMDDVDDARISDNMVDNGAGAGATSIRLTNCLNSTCFVYQNKVDNPIVGGMCANNTGYVVRNAGIGTLAVSTARVSIAHGLSVTPNWAVVTAEEEVAIVAVTSINATELTIESSPGTAPTCTLYWQAMLTTQTMYN